MAVSGEPETTSGQTNESTNIGTKTKDDLHKDPEIENCQGSAKSECSETESARPTSSVSPMSSNQDEVLPEVDEDEPARPPRLCDSGMPSYCNVPSSGINGQGFQAPTLPKRQPNLRTSCTSPSLPMPKLKPPPPPPPPPGLQAPVPEDYHDPRDLRANIYQNQTVEQRNAATLPYRRRIQARRRTRLGGGNSFSCDGCQCPMTKRAQSREGLPHEDVVLIYSRHCPGGNEWAKYLTKLFSELSKHKGRLDVRHLPVEDLASSVLPSQVEADIYQSRLQIVLLSPALLQFLFKTPNFLLGKLLHPDRVLAVMLGVKDSQILAEHREGLVSFPQWIHLEAKDHDLEFVQTVLYFCTQILNRTDSRRSRRLNSVTSAKSAGPPGSSVANNDVFHIHPKKVTENHSRLVIIFETPQSPSSHFCLSLERNHPDLSTVFLDEWRLINAYNIQVLIPRSCFIVTNLASLRVTVDGVDKGTRIIKLESPLSELDQILKNVLDPMDFMCQSMGIANKDHLDKVLTKTLMNKIPKNGFSSLKFAKDEIDKPFIERDETQFPTLLHFSAFHGLQHLSTMLLECPGVRIALDVKNCNDHTPGELAQLNGHEQLAEKLFNFQSGLTQPHIYDYVHQTQINKGTLTSASEYQIPPPPRPIEVSGEIITNNTEEATEAERYSTPASRRKSSFGMIAARFRQVKENTKVPLAQESPIYQQIKSPPRPVDPFGTMKALNRKNKDSRADADDEDDVFLPQNKGDPFGTLRANKAALNNKDIVDYREHKQIAPKSYEEELAITNELLVLLEDFRAKSYSVKQMEVMFDHWRRKASLCDSTQKAKSTKEIDDVREKLRKYTSNSTLMRLFKSSKPEPAKENEINSPNFEETHGKLPKNANASIPEGEMCIINENDMSVVILPPTPQKTPELHHGVSSQILPLSRLSSGGSSPPDCEKVLQSPVKDKLQKFGKTLTEPLVQYFMDLQATPDSEEPEVLNTPKSVAPNEQPKSEKKAATSRNLFNTKKSNNEMKQYENIPPITITDM